MTPPTANYSQGQIDQLTESMRAGFGEIKNMLVALDERVRAIEKNEAGCYPVMSSKIDAAWREIDVLKTKADDRLQRLADVEHNVRVMQKALIWLSSAVGALVLGLMWQLLTGQIHLTP
jgi:putative hemolysin